MDRLIQLSPERLIDQMGPGFVTSADRYLRLLDAPLLRRLPMIRNLVAYREKSPAEAVTLAANYLGHLIQRFLDMVYFLADLQGTLSPPVFLDRLGATIVNATRTPAKRLLWMGSAFLLLFLIVNALPFPVPFRGFVDQLQNLLGWPVIVLGVICLGFWLLGLLVPQDRQPVGRLLRAGRRGPVRGPDQEPQVPPPRPGRPVPGGAGHRSRAPPPLVGRSPARDLPPPRRRRGREASDRQGPLREPRADLPEEHPPALPGLPRRLAVPPQRHEGVGPAPGQPRPDQPPAQPPRPPAPRGPGPRPARPEPRGRTLRRSLPLVQLHHPDDRPGDGHPAPGLQPARDPARPAGLLAGRIAARNSGTGWRRRLRIEPEDVWLPEPS